MVDIANVVIPKIIHPHWTRNGWKWRFSSWVYHIISIGGPRVNTWGHLKIRKMHVKLRTAVAWILSHRANGYGQITWINGSMEEFRQIQWDIIWYNDIKYDKYHKYDIPLPTPLMSEFPGQAIEIPCRIGPIDDRPHRWSQANLDKVQRMLKDLTQLGWVGFFTLGAIGKWWASHMGMSKMGKENSTIGWKNTKRWSWMTGRLGTISTMTLETPMTGDTRNSASMYPIQRPSGSRSKAQLMVSGSRSIFELVAPYTPKQSPEFGKHSGTSFQLPTPSKFDI